MEHPGETLVKRFIVLYVPPCASPLHFNTLFKLDLSRPAAGDHGPTLSLEKESDVADIPSAEQRSVAGTQPERRSGALRTAGGLAGLNDPPGQLPRGQVQSDNGNTLE
jgi:hypothetical protein